MSRSRNKEKGTDDLLLYFKNFKTLFLTNLIFAVPLVVSLAVFYLAGILINQQNIIILALSVILFFPFYAGVTQVTRNIARGEKVEKVFSTFIKGVKANYKQFIVHGVLAYLSMMITFFSVITYWALASNTPILYVMFALSIIIGIVLLFAMYIVPILTVTIDLPLKHIYKNCLIMAAGELKTNLFITLVLAAVGIVIFSVPFLFSNAILGFILLSVFGVFIAPATISYITSVKLYPRIKKLLIEQEEPKEDIKSLQPTQQSDNSENINTQTLSNTEDDYIFQNGRMIKRSLVNKDNTIIDESD